MSDHSKALKKVSTSAEIDGFIKRSATLPLSTSNKRGRLLFALDATASREPTWDSASDLQCRMFANTKALGSLSVQLCYFFGYKQFKYTPWLEDSMRLTGVMGDVRCMAGATQISRVFQHALAETMAQRVHALVYIGDCIEESIDYLGELAGQLKLHGTPVFIFHEGSDSYATDGFRQIARLSGGAYAPFNLSSVGALEALLSAAAAFSIGGADALQHLPESQLKYAKLLEQQLRG